MWRRTDRLLKRMRQTCFVDYWRLKFWKILLLLPITSWYETASDIIRCYILTCLYPPPWPQKSPEIVSLPEGNAQSHGQHQFSHAAFEYNNNSLIPSNGGGSNGDHDPYFEYINNLQVLDDQEIPLKMNCDTYDLKLIVQNTSNLIKSFENKRAAMINILESLCAISISMHDALEAVDGSKPVKNIDKKLNKAEKMHPEALASSSTELFTPPKEDIREDITNDHAAAGRCQYYVEQTPPLNMDAAIPTTDMMKLKQEMMNHISTHRQMWSRQQDQLQVGRLTPAQADTESVVNMNTDPLSSSFMLPNWTDVPVLIPPAQSNAMPIFNSATYNNQDQKKGDIDGVFDWNVDVDELDEDHLFNFLG